MAQRYQREIEEILDKVNDGAPEEGGQKRTGSQRKAAQPKRAPRSGPSRFPSLSISPVRLLVIGVVLLFAALVLPSGIAAPAAWLGIGLLVVAYIMFFTKPRRGTERRWRGQVIDDGSPEESPLQRFWRWLTRG
ncbi:MAG: hypothetical protein WD533_08630 [Dehalococcoidia bacterium]